MDRVMVKFTFSVDGSIDAVFAVSTQLVVSQIAGWKCFLGANRVHRVAICRPEVEF